MASLALGLGFAQLAGKGILIAAVIPTRVFSKVVFAFDTSISLGLGDIIGDSIHSPI